MNQAKSVDQYLGQSEWQNALQILREIVLSTSLEETVKWGAPAYTYKGKTIIGMAGFKAYCGLWFHQGVFLKDEAKVLVNAQEGVTKALRQWRFSSIDEIKANQDLIKTYVLEAIDNQIAGKVMKAEKKPLLIPEQLQVKLDESAELKAKFELLNLTKKREFAEYISDAKREDTKLKRLDKIVPMIIDGIGLNDKYR